MPRWWKRLDRIRKSVVLRQNRDQGRTNKVAKCVGNKELKSVGDSTYGVRNDVAEEGWGPPVTQTKNVDHSESKDQQHIARIF